MITWLLEHSIQPNIKENGKVKFLFEPVLRARKLRVE